MSRSNHLRRRIDAIAEAYSSTFAARFGRLTEAEKVIYRAWKQRSRRHYDRYPGSDAYARALRGEASPTLTNSIREQLFGRFPKVTIDLTEQEAAEIYQKILRGDV